MVYKKYITKNGKVYGPYFYQSRRINGKVVSEYHGIDSKNDNSPVKKIFFIVLASILFLGIVGLLIFNEQRVSGNVVFDIGGTVIDGELKNGKLDLILNEGELIPSNSEIIFENNGSIQKYNLQEFINFKTENGSFFLENSLLSGYGEGYGIPGEKEVYPTINFEIITLSPENEGKTEEPQNDVNEENETIVEESNESVVNETEVDVNEENETIVEEINETPVDVTEESNTEENTVEESNTEENTVEESNTEENTVEEDVTEETSTEKDKSKEKEASTEKIEENSPPLTGNIITNAFGRISGFITGFTVGNETQETNEVISGEVSKDKEFRVRGENAQIVSKSVKLNGEILPESTITIENQGNFIIVKTEYKTIETGFGEEYLGTKTKTFSLDLKKLNGTITTGELSIKITHEGNEIASFSKKIDEESFSEEETLNNMTEIFNETNVTIPELLNLTEKLTQSEKDMILFYLNESAINTSAQKYRDRYLIKLELGPYSAEYSYSQNLSEEELAYYMERDRYLWVKDVLRKLEEKIPNRESEGNLSGTFEI
ncbi:MAG: hypothetical protein NUV46_03020 [Nanoarchaeota archaeon]|nr:hypothetical protein [Nanoarchaeota archaeon]